MNVHPYLGKRSNFTTNIFQIGWFNHQVDILGLGICFFCYQVKQVLATVPSTELIRRSDNAPRRWVGGGFLKKWFLVLPWYLRKMVTHFQLHTKQVIGNSLTIPVVLPFAFFEFVFDMFKCTTFYDKTSIVQRYWEVYTQPKGWLIDEL